MTTTRATQRSQPMAKALTKKQVHTLFLRLRQHQPKPQTELQFESAFELLIAVILSAQSTDKSVNKATASLFTVANTPEKIIQLGEDTLRQFIRTIGLYNAKAKHIIACCRHLIAHYQGCVPQERKALEALPGVGRKTANVVLNVAFGHPTIAVDTHVFRVANRTGLASGRTVFDVEKGLTTRIPAEFLHNAHHWLLLHGRWICKARQPLCPKCAIRDLCRYPAKTLANASSGSKKASS